MRLIWLAVSLALALILAVFSLQAPTPWPASAPTSEFAAGRAMTDIRQIAR